MAHDINNNEEKSMYEERLITLNRVAKVMKGGRRFRFAALMVLGDKNGHVGLGYGKANEVPDAIRKAIEQAKKNMIEVNLKGETIPHNTVGVFRSSRIVMKPASKGTGVISGGPARAVLELAGVKNILSKSLGNNNSMNLAKATFEGLKSLKTVEYMANKRGVSIDQVKSPIGYEKSQRDTVVALGFKKGKRVVEKEATPQINGMINKISHLLKVEYK